MGRQWEDNGKTIEETQETMVFPCNFKDLFLDLHSECAWDSSIQPQLWSSFEIYSNTIVSHNIHNMYIIYSNYNISYPWKVACPKWMAWDIQHICLQQLCTPGLGIYLQVYIYIFTQWVTFTMVEHYCSTAEALLSEMWTKHCKAVGPGGPPPPKAIMAQNTGKRYGPPKLHTLW